MVSIPRGEGPLEVGRAGRTRLTPPLYHRAASGRLRGNQNAAGTGAGGTSAQMTMFWLNKGTSTRFRCAS